MKDKYSTLIKATWVVLICCFIVKLFGGNFFEIACNNEKFIRFCAVFSTGVPYYIINYVLYHVGTYYYFKAVLKTQNLNNKKYIVHCVICFVWILKLLLTLKIGNNTLVFLLYDTVFMIIFPLIIDSKKFKRALIGYVINLIFQIITLITKNIGLKLLTDNLLIIIIYSIDYYIMVILYYLYSIKEDKENASWSFISRFRKRRNDNSNR